MLSRGMDLCFVLKIILLMISFSIVIAQTCKGQCGQRWETCSCHVTCDSLHTCCVDYRQFCLEVFPYSGTMFGGTDFMVLNATFDRSASLICRFNGDINTVGYVDKDGRGHCISPLLYETGWIPFQISTDGGKTFSSEGAWLSVHPGKLDPHFKATLVNSTKWQYYGTPNIGGVLNMTWNMSHVRADRVNVELWGYSEKGEPYTDAWLPEWKYLYSLGKNLPNNGQFSFVPQPAERPFSDWELGCIRVSSSSHPDGERNVHAVWTEDHALAWHLEERFRQDSSSWALEKCLKWDELERRLPDFLNETIDCPCTLAQARADTGRFHTDYGCDIEKGSVCTYHPGSVHCVRAIQASPRYGAGQQCCYDSTGTQVLTADSIGGSTPDRGHDWGSPPYRRPPRVPGASHWIYDVLSFYYCCLWSHNCHYYFTHRPSSDCRTYRPPRAGVVFGDPHFITFDGTHYSFNGKGEYSLLVSPDRGLSVQGRTEPVQLENGTLAKAARLSAVAMKEQSSDVIEVRLSDQLDHLEVLRNQQVLSFSEQKWMDLKGVFVFSPIPQNVTVMFPSGAGVEVRGRAGNLATTVLLPEEFKDHTLGLLGRMNDDPQDDLVTSNGTVLPPDLDSPQDLFGFGADWAITNDTSLFTYDSEYLLSTYYFGPKHDTSFLPVFSVPENPDDPLHAEVIKLCVGEGSQFCRFDTLITRSLGVGNATGVSFQSHKLLVEALQPVVSCGWLGPPSNGRKEGTRYLQEAVLKFSCNTGYILSGAGERICQVDGQWSGDPAYCVSDKTPNTLGIVLGSVIGALALVTMLAMIFLHSRKKKHRDTEDVEVKEI